MEETEASAGMHEMKPSSSSALLLCIFEANMIVKLPPPTTLYSPSQFDNNDEEIRALQRQSEIEQYSTL
jgi:hypothetical protein